MSHWNTIKKTNIPADLTTKWLLELSEYSYTFECVLGSFNLLADNLSRCNFQNNQLTLSSYSKLIFDTQLLSIVDNDIEINN